MIQDTFGQNLQTLRKQRGFTRAKLAEVSQVSMRTLAYWESDERMPREIEMRAALEALRVSPAEKARLMMKLAALRGDNIVRRDEALLQSVANMPLPGAGELLRALRVRKGLPCDRAAVLLGVSDATLSRWESNRVAVPDSILPRAQTVLNASTEEMLTLQNRLMFPAEEETEFSLERCQEQVEAFEARHFLPGAASVDLEALALQRKFWLLAAACPEVRPLLARVTVDYAAWLFWHNRQAETRRQAQYAVNIYAKEAQRDNAFADAVNVLVWGKFLGPEPKQQSAERFLRSWFPQMTHPANQSHLLIITSLSAAYSGDLDLAKRYLHEASCIAEREAATGEPLREYLQDAEARLFLLDGKPAEAYAVFARLIPDIDAIPSTVSLNNSVIIADILLTAGERGLAEKWLASIYARLEPLEPSTFRDRADRLAQRL